MTHNYLRSFRELLLPVSGQRSPRFAFIAEGRFLAEQILHQAKVRVPWVPPLALYIKERWAPSGRHAVVLRSRFFMSLMGELMRSLLRELVSLNANRAPVDITFLGVDKQFDETWISLHQLASYSAAILYPNDVHQRTFHEVYRMGMPIFMPDSFGLFRAQRGANWGYTSYGGSLGAEFVAPGDEALMLLPHAPWWNSFNATPDVVATFQQFADWEQFPHVQRFASLPALLDALLTVDLDDISRGMRSFHAGLEAEALKISAFHMAELL